ncbi:MAG: COG1470 family protein, partial [Thermoguttaceae bacterium]
MDVGAKERTCRAEDWAMRRSGAKSRIAILLAVLCTVQGWGCNSLPSSHIDPTGEHIFTRSPLPANPATRYPSNVYAPSDNVALILTPRETMAPVGSEVVLITGVGAADGFLRSYQRVEWSITPGSVGQFIDLNQSSFLDVLMGDFNAPEIINNTYAIGSTSGKDAKLTRRTPSPTTISVTKGQAWITVTSPIAGDSYVTAFSPDILPCESRMKTAVIHWVDAAWCFPPPAISPAGSKHVFTTTITRQTNQCPAAGWRVRYSITGGPPAGFSPNGATSVEVVSDSSGKASAEIFQKSSVHGTNQICIEVVRPAEATGAKTRTEVIGKGSTMITWSAADIGVKMFGPAVGAPGSTLTYRIEVNNPGDLSAKELLAVSNVPEGLVYLDSNPAAESAGNRLQWRLGELGPLQHRTIYVNYRAEKECSVSNCVELSATGGLKKSDCASTIISKTAESPPAIDLKVTGPSVATVGSLATFDILLTNRGRTGIDILTVKDRFEPGFEHEVSKDKRTLENDVRNLGPGQSAKLDLTFRVTQAGRLCHVVEVLKQDIVLAREQSCLSASAETTSAPGVASPG